MAGDTGPTSDASCLYVVDDHEDSREMLTAYLEIEGFEACGFGTAEDALAAVATRVPALVLTDITLPGMSGVDLARQMKADPRTRAVPIVAISGFDVASREGAELFASTQTKPVLPEALASVVRDLLSKST